MNDSLFSQLANLVHTPCNVWSMCNNNWALNVHIFSHIVCQRFIGLVNPQHETWRLVALPIKITFLVTGFHCIHLRVLVCRPCLAQESRISAIWAYCYHSVMTIAPTRGRHKPAQDKLAFFDSFLNVLWRIIFIFTFIAMCCRAVHLHWVRMTLN
jgi:hypothetical protein